MSKYLNRFRAITKEIQGIAHFELLDFTAQPAATAEQLKFAETKMKAPLDAAQRAFYSETNGLLLHWRIKRDISPQDAKRLKAKSRDYGVKIAEYVGDPFAMINILPIEETLVTRHTKAVRIEDQSEAVKLGALSYSASQVSKAMKPFDVFSEEHCMAFLLLPEGESPRVALLEEGCSTWNHSRLGSFASYLEMLIATRGIVEARLNLFGNAGSDPEPVLDGDAAYWAKKYTPDLFK